MSDAIEYRIKYNGPVPFFIENLGDNLDVESLTLKFLCPSSKCHWFEEGQNSKCKWKEDGCENPAAILNMAIRAEDMLMKIRRQC